MKRATKANGNAADSAPAVPPNATTERDPIGSAHVSASPTIASMFGDDAKLDVAEAAAFLGLGVATLNDWRYRKRGPTYLKFGARIKYRLRDLKAWEAQQQVVATEGA